MGYDVHITRSDDWSKNASHAIAADEWLVVVDADPELQLDPENGPYAAVWTPKTGRNEGWFDWYEGNVFTTNPSRPAVAKMIALAERLSALVQGDEGEVYETARDWRLRDT